MKNGVIWFGHLMAIFSGILLIAWFVRGILSEFEALYFYRFLVVLVLTILVYVSPLLFKEAKEKR